MWPPRAFRRDEASQPDWISELSRPALRLGYIASALVAWTALEDAHGPWRQWQFTEYSVPERGLRGVISAAPNPKPPSGCGIGCVTGVLLTFTQPLAVGQLGSLAIYEPALPRIPGLKTKGHTPVHQFLNTQQDEVDHCWFALGRGCRRHSYAGSHACKSI